MEIRIKYSKGQPHIIIVKELEDRFLDMNEALQECIVGLTEYLDVVDDSYGRSIKVDYDLLQGVEEDGE